MIELRNIETFFWVATLGSFRAASDKLNTTQPAVSQRIASLEADLGVRLFERDSRGVKLTAKGHELLSHAERMLQVRRDMFEAAREQNVMTGTVRIGVAETIVQTWLPTLIELVHASYPALVLEIEVDTTHVLRSHLMSRQIDLAFLMGPVLEFLTGTRIAVTGAAMQPQVNGQPAPMWQTIPVKQGDRLSFSPIKSGCRAYIAFAGGLDVPVVMGSKSTNLKAQIGGFQGRMLKKDDIVPIKAPSGPEKLWAADTRYIPEYPKQITLRVVLGPQDQAFTREGIADFLNTEYRVTPANDRMGYRLEGKEIAHATGADIVSDGIVMGAVQVPSSGQPIILMADRQSTGGYTKIATVVTAGEHGRLAFFVFFNANGEETKNVFVDAHLAFHFGNGCSRSVNVYERVIRLAILLDTVGEGTQTPAFDLTDLAAISFEDTLVLFDESVDLLLGNVLAGKKHMFIKSHWLCLSSLYHADTSG